MRSYSDFSNLGVVVSGRHSDALGARDGGVSAHGCNGLMLPPSRLAVPTHPVLLGNRRSMLDDSWRCSVAMLRGDETKRAQAGFNGGSSGQKRGGGTRRRYASCRGRSRDFNRGAAWC